MLGQTVDEKIKNCRRRKEKKSHRTFLPNSYTISCIPQFVFQQRSISTHTKN